jgi:hypothetical protein
MPLPNLYIVSYSTILPEEWCSGIRPKTYKPLKKTEPKTTLTYCITLLFAFYGFETHQLYPAIST